MVVCSQYLYFHQNKKKEVLLSEDTPQMSSINVLLIVYK